MNSSLSRISIDQRGFTLVEISIVMTIIGLLIGGIFGGMKLVDNANVQKTIQDIKAIESSALTFRDTYRALPGDIRNPATRIPNCAVAPCATGGNGDRILGVVNVSSNTEAQTTTSEKFLFWQHLQASELLSLGVKNTTDMSFGEGQPEAPFGGGYRMHVYAQGAITAQTQTTNKHLMFLTGVPVDAINIADAVIAAQHRALTCYQMATIDRKIDDFKPRSGKVFAHTDCLVNPADETTDYSSTNAGVSSLLYMLSF